MKIRFLDVAILVTLALALGSIGADICGFIWP